MNNMISKTRSTRRSVRTLGHRTHVFVEAGYHCDVTGPRLGWNARVRDALRNQVMGHFM